MNESAASVRQAVEADLEGLASLCAQLGYEAPLPELASRLSKLLDDPRSDVFVAETEGLVGLATLYYVPVVHEPGSWARLTALVVDEAERGRGVGAALIDSAERAARARGCSRIEATSAVHRSGAHQFYERHGYRHVSAYLLKRLD